MKQVKFDTKIINQNLDILIESNLKKNIRHVFINISMSKTTELEYAGKRKIWEVQNRAYSVHDYFLNYHYQQIQDLSEIDGFEFYHLVREHTTTSSNPNEAKWFVMLGYKDFTGVEDPIVDEIKLLFANTYLTTNVNLCISALEIKNRYNCLFQNTSMQYSNHELYYPAGGESAYAFFFNRLLHLVGNNNFMKAVNTSKESKNWKTIDKYCPLKILPNTDYDFCTWQVYNLLQIYLKENNLIIKNAIIYLKKNNKLKKIDDLNFFIKKQNKVIKWLSSLLPTQVGYLTKTNYFIRYIPKAIDILKYKQ